MEGYLFNIICFSLFFSLSASWLLGFLASWLFGFLASWLLGFAASWLLGFLACWLLGFWGSRLFVGLCGFWWLFGFGFSHPLLSQFLSGLYQHHQFRPLNHHFFEHHGGGAPPQPTCYCLDCLQSNCTLFKHHGGGCRPPQPPGYFLDFLQRLNCTPI